MTRFFLKTSEGSISASRGVIQIEMNSGRVRSLVLDQYQVELLVSADGLISEFMNQADLGLAKELMIGAKVPPEEVLRGKKALDRPMLTVALAQHDKIWFGYAAKPTASRSRHRHRLLLSKDFFEELLEVASGVDLPDCDFELSPEFWVIRGRFEDGERKFTFNTVSALLEYAPGKMLGIKREDSELWESLGDVAATIAKRDPGSYIDGWSPDAMRPEFEATIEVIGEDEVNITLDWNGFTQFEDKFDGSFLAQVSMLIGNLWPKESTEVHLAFLYDEDDEDDD